MPVRFLLLCGFTLLNLRGFGQSPDTLRFTLVEAVNYAVANNLQLKSTQLNEDINQFKIKEVKASALPQLIGNTSFTDNYSRGSQLLPGEIFGQPGVTIPVQFGTRFNMGATGQLTQTLFSPSLNVGIKAAKQSQGLYEMQTFKTKEELIYNVVNLYMQVQITEKQEELVEGNITRIQRLLQITNAQFKEGIIKKVDVDQLRVNLTNLQTQLSNVANTRVQLLNNLKTLMNVSVERPIAVRETGTEPIPVVRQLLLNENTDLNLLDYQMRLQDLNTQNIKAGYLPSLNLSANYGWTGQADKLFKSGATTGFTSGSYSLGLSIPIFDGGAKRHRITQSNIALKQLQLNKQYATKNIQNNFQTALNNLNQNERVSRAQQENIAVAEELYNITRLSYTEGVAPLSELINAENGLREAQSQYLTATLQMNLAELDLMRNSGQLSQLIRATPVTK